METKHTASYITVIRTCTALEKLLSVININLTVRIYVLKFIATNIYLKGLINNVLVERDGTAASKKTHLDNLWRMVRFCENRTECRRVMQLNYFGEKFSREECKSRPSTACDNCLSKVRNLLLIAFCFCQCIYN